MTDQTVPATPENVGRGATFALLVIPIALVIFAIVGGVIGLIPGLAAVVVPGIANWLYLKGAGVPQARTGRGALIAIIAVAVILGLIVGTIGAFYHGFLSVNGKGGLFGPAFATTLRNGLGNIEDVILPILLGLGLGAAGIAGIFGNKNRRQQAATVAAPQQPDVPAAAAPPAAPAAPAVTPPNQPSPGILLNGKPLDPQQK